jgi:hypothetical protein
MVTNGSRVAFRAGIAVNDPVRLREAGRQEPMAQTCGPVQSRQLCSGAWPSVRPALSIENKAPRSPTCSTSSTQEWVVKSTDGKRRGASSGPGRDYSLLSSSSN